MSENKENIVKFNNDIGSLKEKVKKLEPEYEKNPRSRSAKLRVAERI